MCQRICLRRIHLPNWLLSCLLIKRLQKRRRENGETLMSGSKKIYHKVAVATTDLLKQGKNSCLIRLRSTHCLLSLLK